MRILVRRITLIRQITVILRKEWEDINSTFFSYHNFSAGIWPILLICVAFGFYEPLRIGPEWLQSNTMVISISLLIPFITIGFISPYSFVGERMRGTLEPLLASPVSDQAILFGKIGIAILFGWGVTLIVMLLGLGVINIFLANGNFLFYLPELAMPTLLLSLLFSILVATIGTNSSLYAKTILEAQRILVTTLFIPILLPSFFLSPFMPEDWKVLIVQIITQLGTNTLLLIFIVLLFIVDGIFMVIAQIRFNRKLLILESN